MFKSPIEVQKKRLDSRYEIGSDGNVYSDGLVLEPINGIGVNIRGQRKKIAYLVARAFLPNPESRPYVRHKNGDVTDNRLENLEWSEKMEVRRRGPKPKVRYCSAYSLDGEKVGVYRNPAEGALDLGANVRSVKNCLNGRQKTAGGYLWRWGA